VAPVTSSSREDTAGRAPAGVSRRQFYRAGRPVPPVPRLRPLRPRRADSGALPTGVAAYGKFWGTDRHRQYSALTGDVFTMWTTVRLPVRPAVVSGTGISCIQGAV